MRKTHASGHISQPEIREMIESIDPLKLFTIHTEKPEWFRRFASDSPNLMHGRKYYL
jgi:mRNA degradation ribonuclease J1/J2